jgi:mono/diheme cytochrome c family protein
MQMKRNHSTIAFAALTAFLLSGMVARAVPQAVPAPSDPTRVARGKYLVDIMGCHDCHTPLKFGPPGPQPDMDRALSGHPEQVPMPPAPALPPGPWGMVGAATSTAFAGPWGVSFTANLTPDNETGLGTWTQEMFIATMKTGRHQGKGRPILPPMPVQNLRFLSDGDIRDLFAYLQSLKPVHNRVPAPIDPPDAPGAPTN